ncbi:MAG: hypothetical protein QOI47_2636, partial [Actinomycetota bacterium]|nr:hypothetical protein [Actinomycetota bacterium]
MLAVVLTAIFPAPVARGAVPVVVVDGRGRGHGVGMAQDGAYWMGKEGASMEQILGHFYPGTGRGSTKGTVRVVVLVSPENRTTLDFPDGGEVRSPRSGTQRPGFPVQVPPGGSVSITHDGGYRVETLDVPVSPASARAGGAAIDLPSSSTTTTTTRPSTTTSTTMFPAITTPTAPTTSTTRPAITTTTTRPGTPPTSRPRQRAVV